MKQLNYAKYQFLSLQYYRLDALFMILSSLGLAIVQYNLWAFVEGRENLPIDMKNYALYAILLSLLLVTNSTTTFISDKVLKGTIANWLMHPFSLLMISFNIQLGTLLYKFVYQFCPILLIYLLFFDWQPPQWHIQVFITLILSFLLSFIVGYILAMLSTVMMNIRGILNLNTVLLTIFGGSMIAIDLYPQWLQAFCVYTPFYYISYVPLKILTAQTSYISNHLIGFQLIWLIVLVIIAVNITKLLSKKMTVMGG